jgi:hypothetical protein
MATLTEMVAVVVVHSSALAFSHFGVTLDPARVETPHPADERVVARSPRPRARTAAPVERAAACPDAKPAQVVRT